MSDPSSLFLVTGTWGVGKTRVLELLEPEFSVVEEPGRRVARQAGDFDPESFTQSVSNLTRAAHLRAIDQVEVSLFDRGTVDCLAYARWFGLDEAPFWRDVAQLRYHENASFFPVWPESGYKLVGVPQRDPEERATFLRNELNSRI